MAVPVPTATTSTLMPVFFSKRGKRKSYSRILSAGGGGAAEAGFRPGRPGRQQGGYR
jgi:hypothetical protein